jgi:hypothetical protein
VARANDFGIWYNSHGFWITWLIVIPILLLVSFIPPVRTFLDWLGGVFEEKMDWIPMFLLIILLVGLIYLILFAPYGVLCQLGVKKCGQW